MCEQIVILSYAVDTECNLLRNFAEKEGAGNNLYSKSGVGLNASLGVTS